MSLVAYTLLMFGCADDGTACERIAAPEQVYAAPAQCQAQVDSALGSDLALRADYPVVEVRCVKVSRKALARGSSAHSIAVR
ncbi:MAG: hypothetical protein ACKOOL_04850 [Novosphingobium sp.]